MEPELPWNALVVKVARCHSPSLKAGSTHLATQKQQLIHPSIHNSHALSSPTTPLILYLPPFGAHIRSSHPPIPSFLLSNLGNPLPLAQINYRWNRVSPSPALLSSSPDFADYPFPTPLHDTLHAWSWLTEEYLPSLAPSSQSEPQDKICRHSKPYITPPPSPKPYGNKPRPIIIYGSYLGGTLGATLGLTESSTSRTSLLNITGLIVHNGIFDWTRVATSKDPNPSSSPTSSTTQAGETPLPSITTSKQDPPPSSTRPWTTQTLHTLKTHLFKDPASAFDPFASPTLFFRSSGLSSPIPRSFPGQSPPHPPPRPPPSVDQIDEATVAGLNISDAERADLLSMLGADDLPPASPLKQGNGREEDEEVEWGRKSPLKFPPAGSRLRIPRSLFLYSTPASVLDPKTETKTKTKTKTRDADKGKKTSESEIRMQTEEVVKLMRRSIVMHEFKDRVVWEGEEKEGGDAHAVSEERVRILEVRDGDGDGDGDGEEGKDSSDAEVGRGELEKVVREWIEEIV